MVVELSMQYSRTFFYDSFETYKTFQIHEFGWVRFQNIFLLLNNNDKNIVKILY